MPISDGIFRRAAWGLAILALAGCVSGLGASAPRQTVVTQSAITIVGPDGFCVDETATRDDGATAFVLLGNCAVLSDSGRAAQPAIPAVLTAAISAPSDDGSIADSIPQLGSFFRSAEGRRLLSRTQEAATVEVLDTRVDGEIFLLHANDSSEGPVDGVQDEYWRAYLDLGPRIATLSVLALEEREVSEAESLAVLRRFAAAVQAANPEAGAVAAVAAPPAQTATDAELRRVGIFRRFFD